MRFLTRSYVEALGFEKSTTLHTSSISCFVSEDARKPEARVEIRECVVVGDRLFVDEGDGLCFRRVEPTGRTPMRCERCGTVDALYREIGARCVYCNEGRVYP